MDEAVAKLNIAHFRSLLATPDLSHEKRRTVQQLLTREEHKLDRLKRPRPGLDVNRADQADRR